MRREAKVTVHIVGTRCMSEGLVYLPIHDGFLTLPRQFDRMCEIVREAFCTNCGDSATDQEEVGAVARASGVK
jgi:DNA-directed RNA polymerase